MARGWCWLWFLAFAAVAACGDEDSTKTPSGGGFGTQVVADITTPTAWTTGTTYVVDGAIDVSSALTIQPGTIVKFKPGASLSTSGSGTITAIGGSPATQIVFTSFADDAHGGDANGDRQGSAPGRGDWAGVTVTKSGSSFDHCAFYYAGLDDTAALYIAGTSASVTGSIFAHHGTRDAIDAVPALDATAALAGTVLAGNTFYDDFVPLGIAATFSLDDSNAFDNSAAAPLAPQPSRYNAVVVGGCQTVTSTAGITWAAKKVPLVVGNPTDACNYLQVGGGAHLTLGPDVVMKFFLDGFLDVSGLLTAAGAAGHEVVFTSARDDAHGGDTNHDGAATTPAPGDWSGVRLGANGSSFDHARFMYAGQANTAALWTAYQSATVTSSTFAYNGDTDSIGAIAALDASHALAGTVITGNTFYANIVPLAVNTTFSLDDSNFFDNSAATPLTPRPNTYNAVIGSYCGSVVGSITWSLTKVPFVVGDPDDACTYIEVDITGHFTLGANVTMKFFPGGFISVLLGGTFTRGAGSLLTSVRDDTDGDTNGDGNGSSPAALDWVGVKFYEYGPGGTNVCASSASIMYSTPGCEF